MTGNPITFARSQSPPASYINTGPHHFYIPVMGTGFTIDTPLKVAKFGISSVISIGDDILIEQMRRHYSEVWERPFIPIENQEPNSRVKRIQAYLDLVHDGVMDQLQKLRSGSFVSGSDITRYFELIPEGTLKAAYESMLACSDDGARAKLQAGLRDSIVAGQIDVNIMTKVDREQKQADGKWIPESGLAMTALRGFATSKLQASIVLSAGINKRLFAYMAKFDDFFPTEDAPPRKTIILKVSDYRSALIQGTLLARRGLWVSEYRVESGLNCGGHTFPTKGELLGPVLHEFQANRQKLKTVLREYYYKALEKADRAPYGEPTFLLSAQGGVGTSQEHQFLRKRFDIARVGWGSPFLLVPQATNLASNDLRQLVAADEKDVVLSEASPLGIPFWILKNTASEQHRLKRIAEGTPGRRCLKHFLASDSEFSKEPICLASRQYQEKKLGQIENGDMSQERQKTAQAKVSSRTCLCMDLAAGVLNRFNIDASTHSAVCCGLSATDFNGVYTLREMIDHIYGRSPIALRRQRPDMFMRELSLYIDYLKKKLTERALDIDSISSKYLQEFTQGLCRGILYYRDMFSKAENGPASAILAALDRLEEQVQAIVNGELAECLANKVMPQAAAMKPA